MQFLLAIVAFCMHGQITSEIIIIQWEQFSLVDAFNISSVQAFKVII